MPFQKLQHAASRRGFTLIELVVVLGIVLLLAAITVAFVPSFNKRQRAAKGADQVQQWFLIARQWAKRDRVPTGIRLQPSPGNSTLVMDLQYIQKPDDLDLPRSQLTGPGATANSLTFSGVDFFGGQPAQQQLWLVQPGDYLEVQGGGLVLSIIMVSSSGAKDPNTGLLIGDTLSIDGSQTVPSFTATYQYRILRQPRILSGESPLQMPQDIAIDLRKSIATPTVNTTSTVIVSPAVNVNMQVKSSVNINVGDYLVLDLNNANEETVQVTALSGNTITLAQTTFSHAFGCSVIRFAPLDILFAPSGVVLNQSTSRGATIFWVRDITLDASAPGDETLIAVYARSGFIAAHEVNRDPTVNDPYYNTRDGRSSGM